ncbi:MAG TPA: UDP-glucuronic acid decarboxylase family protein [Acidimicrobiia bacterium]|nr:UDP-glucuronic acid decarboxylase family protein [Acidimicrobiia bacterium]
MVDAEPKRIVVTGGAGFLGSHVCETLFERGDHVICVDNFLTGVRANIESLQHQRRFELIEADVAQGALAVAAGPLHAVLHLASPASPVDYLAHPLETLAVGSEGTRHAIELAADRGARFLLASTSEVYGDPQLHPQVESYWGHVNPIGPRSVYDEAKRFAEALTMAWHRTHGTDVAIARIFNTYGPRMRRDDGRMISNFLAQAVDGSPLTVYGDGSQTRSPCYVDDMVRGLVALLDSACIGPVNLGNPAEISVLDLAHKILELSGSSSPIEYRELPEDDPVRRRPDITVAREQLGWEPQVGLDEGLARTLEALRKVPASG